MVICRSAGLSILRSGPRPTHSSISDEELRSRHCDTRLIPSRTVHNSPGGSHSNSSLCCLGLDVSCQSGHPATPRGPPPRSRLNHQPEQDSGLRRYLLPSLHGAPDKVRSEWKDPRAATRHLSGSGPNRVSIHLPLAPRGAEVSGMGAEMTSADVVTSLDYQRAPGSETRDVLYERQEHQGGKPVHGRGHASSTRTRAGDTQSHMKA